MLWLIVGKTMPFLPVMTGNGDHTSCKNGNDWGMANMTASFTHVTYLFIHSFPKSWDLFFFSKNAKWDMEIPMLCHGGLKSPWFSPMEIPMVLGPPWPRFSPVSGGLGEGGLGLWARLGHRHRQGGHPRAGGAFTAGVGRKGNVNGPNETQTGSRLMHVNGC